MAKSKVKSQHNIYRGTVITIIDGDTYEVLITLGFGVIQKFHVRLDGIDTPEKNTEKGLIAKEYVRGLIEGKTLLLTESGPEKYGRARASITLPDGRDLTTFLIEQNIGIEYHGEAKEKPIANLTMIA